jgi:hypothetical protein
MGPKVKGDNTGTAFERKVHELYPSDEDSDPELEEEEEEEEETEDKPTRRK